MKVGVMQPYFFPYIGYWQLMNAVDRYVIYNDVNFIKGGWINRNRILSGGEPKFFNVPMLGASPNKLISEVKVNLNPKELERNLSILYNCYRKAPYYKQAMEPIRAALSCGKENLADYLAETIFQVASYLDIRTEFIISSDIPKDNSLKGEEKVLQICELLGADEYYNAIGGQTLYSRSHFQARGMDLFFPSEIP